MLAAAGKWEQLVPGITVCIVA